MIKMRTNRGLALIASGVLLLLLTAACSDDGKTTTPESTPPEIPPQSSMVMDFDNFVDDGFITTGAASGLGAGSFINYGQSALRVGFWNLALTVTLAVPVAAFGESFSHEPTQLSDGSWQWSYSVTVVETEYTCRLIGKTVNNEVQWQMYISKEGEYEDYLWFYGSHNLPATEGEWTLNREPNQANPFLLIEWHRNLETQTGDLKYTDATPGQPGNGSYIFYGSMTGSEYDRFYHLFNVVQNNLAEIEWNHTTANGGVKDEFFYGDADWHCWAENLQDIQCP